MNSIKKVNTPYGDVLIVITKKAVGEFVFRNSMWRLERFHMLGIGAREIKVSLDGVDKTLTQEEAMALRVVYHNFEKWFKTWKLFHRKSYLNKEQKRLCLSGRLRPAYRT